MENKLVEIPIEDLPELSEMYRVDWPKYINGCYTVENYHKWLTSDIKINLKLYSLNGVWRKDGTFMIIRDDKIISFNTLQDSCENLKTLISLLDLSKGYLFFCFAEYLRPTTLDVIKAQNIEVAVDDCTHFYYKSKEEALELEKFIKLPDGMCFKTLNDSHASQINQIWAYRFDGSIKYVEYLISLSPSTGLFTNDGELVAWCLRLDTGPLAFLQVEAKHYRKGYGTLVAAEQSRKIAAMGYDVTSNVNVKNTESMNLFDKLGFHKIDKTYWVGVGNFLRLS